MTKSYDELIKLKTFEERYQYLRITQHKVGELTFAGSRYLNQVLYKSKAWQDFRREIIIRDNGCDLGIEDRPVNTKLIVHHINPLTIEQVQNRDACIFSPNNVVCCSIETHNEIHYSDGSNLVPTKPTERRPNDTCPWIH